MRILVLSHVFAPSVGGIELVAQHLAEGLSDLRRTVTVATRTHAGTHSRATAYPVVRSPSWARLLSLVAASPVVLHSNPCSTWIRQPSPDRGRAGSLALQTWATSVRRRPRLAIPTHTQTDSRGIPARSGWCGHRRHGACPSDSPGDLTRQGRVAGARRHRRLPCRRSRQEPRPRASPRPATPHRPTHWLRRKADPT
jgi:hypothetical protein